RRGRHLQARLHVGDYARARSANHIARGGGNGIGGGRCGGGRDWRGRRDRCGRCGCGRGEPLFGGAGDDLGLVVAIVGEELLPAGTHRVRVGPVLLVHLVDQPRILAEENIGKILAHGTSLRGEASVGRVDDRGQIENLMSLYCRLYDSGDFEGYAQLFADAQVVGPLSTLKGAAEVVAYHRSNCLLYDGSPQTRHVTTNIEIDVADDGESAR